MSALAQGSEVRSEVRSAIGAAFQWCVNWLRGNGADLSSIPEYEIERMAKDVRMCPSELRAVAKSGPGGADLLLCRMAALDLDPAEVRDIAPETFRDLQRTCALCESKRRCARDFARHAEDVKWEDYCPNAQTLMALNVLPWASRREW